MQIMNSCFIHTPTHVLEAFGNVVMLDTRVVDAGVKTEIRHDEVTLGDTIEILADGNHSPLRIELFSSDDDGLLWHPQAHHVDPRGFVWWRETPTSCYYEWHELPSYDVQLTVTLTNASGASNKRPILVKIRPRTQG